MGASRRLREEEGEPRTRSQEHPAQPHTSRAGAAVRRERGARAPALLGAWRRGRGARTARPVVSRGRPDRRGQGRVKPRGAQRTRGRGSLTPRAPAGTSVSFYANRNRNRGMNRVNHSSVKYIIS